MNTGVVIYCKGKKDKHFYFTTVVAKLEACTVAVVYSDILIYKLPNLVCIQYSLNQHCA